MNHFQLIFFISDDNRIIIRQKGGIELSIQAMKSLPNCAGVQEQGCVALGSLSFNSNEYFFFDESFSTHFFSFSDDNGIIIGQKGGIELIIQTMKLFPNHAGVQEKACVALWSLALNGNECSFF